MYKYAYVCLEACMCVCFFQTFYKMHVHICTLELNVDIVA